jgi:hypothetical protein
MAGRKEMDNRPAIHLNWAIPPDRSSVAPNASAERVVERARRDGQLGRVAPHFSEMPALLYRLLV